MKRKNLKTLCWLLKNNFSTLGNQGGNCAEFIYPVGWQDTLGLAVTGQSVSTWLDDNKKQFTILILAVKFQMLTNSNSLVDHVVLIFGNIGFKTNKILLPLTQQTWATPWIIHRRMIPIMDFLICFFTWWALGFNQKGTVLLYFKADWEKTLSWSMHMTHLVSKKWIIVPVDEWRT